MKKRVSSQLLEETTKSFISASNKGSLLKIVYGFHQIIIDLKFSNGSTLTLTTKIFIFRNLLNVAMNHSFIFILYQDQMLKQKTMIDLLQ